MTNFERITKSPEALADFIYHHKNVCQGMPCYEHCNNNASYPFQGCHRMLEDWLNAGMKNERT